MSIDIRHVVKTVGDIEGMQLVPRIETKTAINRRWETGIGQPSLQLCYLRSLIAKFQVWSTRPR
jgi:hypothetical protein